MNRDKLLQVRFTADEYVKLCIEAGLAGLSVSEYVRQAIVQVKHNLRRQTLAGRIKHLFGG
jgi:hypothetical protein